MSDVQCVLRDILADEAGDAPSSDPPTERQEKPKSLRDKRADQHRAQRRETAKRVRELARRGASMREIARRTGVHRSTVRRILNGERLHERNPRKYERGTDPFEQLLRRRWKEGCHNARRLIGELRRERFTGSYYMVRRRVAAWRSGEKPMTRADPQRRRMSSKQAAWILMKSSDERSTFEQDFAHRLCKRNPALARMRRISNEFHDIITHNRSSELASWLKEACGSELAVFAEGLKKEESAIRAAAALKWSNGQTEGHVNRLKMLKRQMYGRANLDLLRIRLLSDRFLQQSAA